MKILYAALLCLLMLVGTPFAQAAGTISVGLVADQFTAEISTLTAAVTAANLCLRRASIILTLPTTGLMLKI